MNTKISSRKPTTIPLVISWALVVGWACFIFFMSANTDTGLGEDLGMLSSLFQSLKVIQAQVFGPGVDVVSSLGHFCEYLVFGALLARALHYHLPLRRACLVALICASVYGITDELHQLFVPGRMCDPVDWLVDTIGASLGSGLIYMVIKMRRGARDKEEPR